MARRSLWLFAFVLLAGLALLLARSCGRDDAPAASVTHAPVSDVAADKDGSASIKAVASAQTLEAQRQEAMFTAVETLHRYFAILNGNDSAKADAFWVNDRPPTPSNEADLRALKGLRALRSENHTPKPLDSEPIPGAVEIPVELRASFEGAPSRRYLGWYRLRSLNPAKGEWEITSASIKVDTR